MGPPVKLAAGDGSHVKPNQGVQGMHEGYLGLYFVSTTGGKGLPLELFLGVMRHVRIESEIDLIRASHVCTGWRKATVECADLWNDLDKVCIGSAKDLERLRAFATRSKGFLRRFEVLFEPTPFEQDPASALLALREVYREISERDGARQLAHLRVDFRDLQRLGEPEMTLNCLVHTIHFVELAAVRLRSLRMDTRVERFPAGATVLNALPKLEELTITSRPFVSWDVRLPDFFQQIVSADTIGAHSVSLTTLTLVGVSLPDSAFPDCPNIRSVKLYEVQCCNLLGMLRKAAGTLETLWLFEVEADPANRYLPAAPDSVAQKDVPVALELPHLVDLRLAGGSTPSFWTPPNPTTSDFIVTAPAATKVSLGWQFPSDHEDDDDDEAWIPPAKSPTAEALATLFRNTPALSKLNLTSCGVTAQTLMRAFAFVPSSLTTLCLGGTLATTDDCLDRLHMLVPNLRYLDVFSPIGSTGEPSLAALARFANRLKQRRSLTSWIGSFHLTLIAREPAEGRETATELRNQVRAILLTLSPAQVSHVPSRLSTNPPPNAPPFAEIEHELIALTAPPRKPLLSVNGVANGQPAAAMAANGQPAAANRPAGAQQVFDDACKLTQRWIQEREDELAVQFCRQTLGVDLRWGKGCDDWCYDNHSQHPGFSEWHAVVGEEGDETV